MNITLVKKILKDGSLCPKCADVQAKLEEGGHLAQINTTVIADERDENSEGMLLAKKYQVDRAPFFIVDKENGEAPEIYTVFMKFLKEVLQQTTQEADELKEIMRDNHDLDFI